MKFVDEYRDASSVATLLRAIGKTATRRWTIMEVCGGQTHGLLRSGLDQALADAVELIHGPGCPVCVTSAELIDQAIALACQPGVCLVSFGDMLRVPGSRESLALARARGGQVRAVYSPLDALKLAAGQPEQQFVFFGVGFETTAPATALAVQQADRLGLDNFSLLTAHVRVQPAMETLLAAPDNRVQGFLAAGHVCTITGYQSYQSLCDRWQTPVVVTGFEPLDLATGILACVEQLETGRAAVENRYPRSVTAAGNAHARRLMNEVYEVCDFPWRGLGTMADGGLRLRPSWRHYDAEQRFAAVLQTSRQPVATVSPCRSADVLTGRIKPPECAAFGRECTPLSPLGAPMVSAEGACAAYFHYRAPTPGAIPTGTAAGTSA